MSHKALYRKWRPLTFSDVVGQNHITDTLKTEITTSRIGHAYLFCGTRGTGKTTTAKVLSRAVNCEDLRSNGDPCNQCPSCVGILNNTIMDVVEVDAASNNGVDNIRAIRDEVLYFPSHVRFRVYIIDEVHMLSSGAFNALLKTLEEPPPHVIFVLATTEAHKVPATVQSRCQRFDFRRISTGEIAALLREIAASESIGITDSGINLIASLADGSMRDALSILDQCGNAAGQIDAPAIAKMAGISGYSEIYTLSDAIISEDCGGSLRSLNDAIQKGVEPLTLGEGLLAHFRELLICITVANPENIIDAQPEHLSKLTVQSKNLSVDRLIYIVTRLSQALADAKWANNPRALLEASIVALCDARLCGTTDALLARIERLENQLERGFKAIPVENIVGNKENIVENPLQKDCVTVTPPAKSVDNADKSVENRINTEKNLLKTQNNSVDNVRKPDFTSVDKIKKKLAEMGSSLSHLLTGASVSQAGDTLIITQKRAPFYNSLSKKENLAILEQAVGMSVKVINIENQASTPAPPMQKNTSETHHDEFSETIRIDAVLENAKQLLGDKLVIEG